MAQKYCRTFDLNRLSMVYERYRRQTDGRTGDDIRTLKRLVSDMAHHVASLTFNSARSHKVCGRMYHGGRSSYCT